MAIKKPYYAPHKIISGQYTSGKEYVLSDGVDYVGSYHALPNGQIFTGEIPKKDSQELFEKRIDVSDTVLKYNVLVGAGVSKYISPIPFQPKPTADDYEFGEIQRFFVQKRPDSGGAPSALGSALPRFAPPDALEAARALRW